MGLTLGGLTGATAGRYELLKVTRPIVRRTRGSGLLEARLSYQPQFPAAWIERTRAVSLLSSHFAARKESSQDHSPIAAYCRSDKA